MSLDEYLQYGATGLVALVIFAVLAPILKAFIEELKASRVERVTMRQEHNEFICNHAADVTKALQLVREGLDSVCRRLNDK